MTGSSQGHEWRPLRSSCSVGFRIFESNNFLQVYQQRQILKKLHTRSNCNEKYIPWRLCVITWSWGIQSSHFRTTRPQFSVQIPMHFTLQFSSANDYPRVQWVGIFLEFPTMLLSMCQWGEVCSLCNFMILCIWAVSQLKAKRKEYTIRVIFWGWFFTIFQKIYCWNSLIKTKKKLKIENVLKSFSRNQYIYLQHEGVPEDFHNLNIAKFG